MNVIYVAAAGLALMTAAGFALLFRRLLSPARLDGLSRDWLSSFSVARYRPMERLLDEEDYRFLSSQSGDTTDLVRRLRAERRKIFRGYLGCLKKDFNRLEGLLRLYTVYAEEDRPELVRAILRRRLRFTCAFWAVEFRLLLHSLGMGTVDVRQVLAPLDSMKLQLGQLVLARQSAAG